MWKLSQQMANRIPESNGFLKTVVALRGDFLQQVMPSTMAVASVLCGICCMLYLTKLAVLLLSKKEVSAWDALRPVVVFFFVSTFQLVLIPLDFVFNTAIVAPAVSKIQVESNDVKQKKANFLVNEQRTYDLTLGDLGDFGDGDDPGMEGRLEHSKGHEVLHTIIDICLGPVLTEVINISKVTVMSLCDIVFYFIFGFMKNIIVLLSEIQLAILAVMGPFVFAIDILPGLSGIGTWIARYIQISFWKVTVVIIGLLHAMMVNRCMGLTTGSHALEFAPAMSSIMISVACTVALFSVEKISAYIVQSNGANGATGGFYKGLAVALRKVVTKGV